MRWVGRCPLGRILTAEEMGTVRAEPWSLSLSLSPKPCCEESKQGHKGTAERGIRLSIPGPRAVHTDPEKSSHNIGLGSGILTPPGSVPF